MKGEYNSKLDKNIEAFIQMRIEGKSFDEIATELKTTKQTLIDWNKKELVRNAIAEGKAFKINSIVKTYKFDLSNRLHTYLQLSKKINDELLDRDLTDINTDILLKMSVVNDNRVNEIIKGKKTTFGKPYLEIEVYEDGTPDQYFELKADE